MREAVVYDFAEYWCC